MIHRESWYRESLGEQDLRRLQEEAERGGLQELEALLRYLFRTRAPLPKNLTLDSLRQTVVGKQVLEEGLISSQLPHPELWPFFWEWAVRHSELRDVQFEALKNCPKHYLPLVSFYHIYEIRALSPDDDAHHLDSLGRGSVELTGERLEGDRLNQQADALTFVGVLNRVLGKGGGDEWQSSSYPLEMDTIVTPPPRARIREAIQRVEDEWPEYAPVEIQERREVTIESVLLQGRRVYSEWSSLSRWVEWFLNLGNGGG